MVVEPKISVLAVSNVYHCYALEILREPKGRSFHPRTIVSTVQPSPSDVKMEAIANGKAHSKSS